MAKEPDSCLFRIWKSNLFLIPPFAGWSLHHIFESMVGETANTPELNCDMYRFVLNLRLHALLTSGKLCHLFCPENVNQMFPHLRLSPSKSVLLNLFSNTEPFQNCIRFEEPFIFLNIY